MKETKETPLTLAETLERIKLMSKLYNETKPKTESKIKENKETILAFIKLLGGYKLISKSHNKPKYKIKPLKLLFTISKTIEISTTFNKETNKRETLYILRAFLKEPIQTARGEIDHVICITSRKQKNSKKVINSMAKYIIDCVYIAIPK